MIIYLEQYRLATTDESFHQRVTAAMVFAGVTKFFEAPLTDRVEQAQRKRMIRTLIRDPSATQITSFKWVVVQQPQFTTADDITDDALGQILLGVFDALAQQLIAVADAVADIGN